MSPQLKELLFTIRQHPAFAELLQSVSKPEMQEFSPTKGDAASQYAAYTFRSGARRQHDAWRQFLIGDPTSDKEKS
jgi:hypothetical protein